VGVLRVGVGWVVAVFILGGVLRVGSIAGVGRGRWGGGGGGGGG